MSTRIAAAFWAAVVLALASTATAIAQTNPKDHFTFTVTNYEKANLSAQDRLDVTITRWSTDAERDALVAALKNGAPAVRAELGRQQELGYLSWPGYLKYIVRYAFRSPRPDGGEDVVLAFDRPFTIWWQGDTAKIGTDPSIPNTADFTVIQMRLNKDGKGEGRITMSGKVAASQSQPAMLALDDFQSAPLIVTNVERARSSQTTSN